MLAQDECKIWNERPCRRLQRIYVYVFCDSVVEFFCAVTVSRCAKKRCTLYGFGLAAAKIAHASTLTYLHVRVRLVWAWTEQSSKDFGSLSLTLSLSFYLDSGCIYFQHAKPSRSGSEIYFHKICMSSERDGRKRFLLSLCSQLLDNLCKRKFYRLLLNQLNLLSFPINAFDYPFKGW